MKKLITKPQKCDKIVNMIKLDPPNKTLFIDTEKELERLKDEIKNNDNEFFKMIKLLLVIS